MSPASDRKGGPVRLAAGGHGLSAGGVFTLSLSLAGSNAVTPFPVHGPLAAAAGRAGGRCSRADGCRATPPVPGRTVRAHHPGRASFHASQGTAIRTGPDAPGPPAAPGCQNPPAHPVRNPPDDPWAPARTHHRKLPCLYGQCGGQDRETGGFPGECGPGTADTNTRYIGYRPTR